MGVVLPFRNFHHVSSASVTPKAIAMDRHEKPASLPP